MTAHGQGPQGGAAGDTGLPFGAGDWVVWGYPTVERDTNAGLTAGDQPLVGPGGAVGGPPPQDIELYRTTSEEEARGLVQAAGFERNGVFYATTRISNSAASAHEQARQAQSGVLQRDPLARRRDDMPRKGEV